MTAHFKTKVNRLEDEDKEIWNMATNVPLVSQPIAVVSAILNFLIPGFGTLLAACQTKANYVSKAQLTIAFI